MKDKILEQAAKETGAEAKMNRLREALHHLILQEADRKQAFHSICFLGGTALRIVYGLDRFSEDLDFSLSAQAPGVFHLEPLAKAVARSLQAFGLNGTVERPKTVGAVQSCFFTFPGLLHELDRRFRAAQKLAIKFDVDTKPPAGAVEQVSPITAARLYKVRHYDLPSLFAGKLHAVLYRDYTKGRDLYDFLWYTGRQAAVNARLLENAIAQTQRRRITVTTESLRALLRQKFQSIDFAKARQDAAPFLEHPDARSLFDRPIFLNAVERVVVG